MPKVTGLWKSVLKIHSEFSMVAVYFGSIKSLYVVLNGVFGERLFLC